MWLALAGSAFAGVEDLAGWLDKPADDLLLDDESMAKSDALGYYAWGVFLHLQGRPLSESHEGYLARAVAANPGSGPLLRALVEPWIEARDYKTVTRILAPIAEMHPDAADLHVFLGLMHHAAGEGGEAIAAFEHVYYNLRRRHPVVIREMVSLYWRENRRDEIPRLLENAGGSKELKGHFVIDFALALYHNSLAEGEASQPLSGKATRKHAALAVRHATAAAAKLTAENSLDDGESLLNVLAAREEWNQALALIDRIAVIHPDSAGPLKMRRISCLVAAGDTAAAAALLESIDPLGIFDARQLAEMGQLAAQVDNFDLAVSCHIRALSLAPRALSVRLFCAMLLFHTDRTDKCLELLAEADALNGQGYLLKARALMRLERWEDALAAWTKSARIAEKMGDERLPDADYHLTGATLFEETGNPDAAIAEAEKALAMTPENPVALNFLGYLLADHGRRLDEAEKLVAAALAAVPDSDAFLDSLAWIYYRQQRYPQAMEAMAKCLGHAGLDADPVILDHAGDIFMAVGAPQLAAAYWHQAIAAGARNPGQIRAKIEDTDNTD